MRGDREMDKVARGTDREREEPIHPTVAPTFSFSFSLSLSLSLLSLSEARSFFACVCVVDTNIHTGGACRVMVCEVFRLLFII